MSLSAQIIEKARVLNALLLRELMQRYGHGNLGFLWLILEPLLLTVGVMMLWSAMYGQTRHGVNVAPFVLTGYSVLTLWRQGVSRSILVFRHSAELLFHRQIQPIDVFVTRMFLEIFGVLIAFFTAYVPLLLLDLVEPIDDYLLLLGGWFLLSYFCLGVGLIIAALTELSDTAERLVQPLMYVSLMFSGAFFMVAWLPTQAQQVVLLSPLVHGVEMVRSGFFGPGVPATYSVGYILSAGILVNAVGWAMVRRATHAIEMS